MAAMTRGQVGDAGEVEVVKLVPCPNCGKRLSQLPKNYPMYDVQCTACSFRAQVKTSSTRPKDKVFGAGWDVVEKVLKAGFMLPPVFVNFRWISGRRRVNVIVFFPFTPRTHIQKYTLSSKAQRAGYRMFEYVRLSKIPHLRVYDSRPAVPENSLF